MAKRNRLELGGDDLEQLFNGLGIRVRLMPGEEHFLIVVCSDKEKAIIEHIQSQMEVQP